MNLGELFVRIGASLKGFDETMGKVEQKLHKVGEKLQRTGVGLSLAITAPMAALAAGALKSAIGFETAMASVRKNVDGTEEDLKKLGHGFEDLSTRIPATTKEIAAVASVAGQLGIASENVLQFTEVMIAMGETTNLSAIDAATALAKIANITRLPETQFDRLASTILKLGKTTKAQEAQITEFALRISGAGTVVGMTQAEILGFSAALASAGVEAEAGGTAISKLMVKIASAVEKGGQELDDFAAVAGTSSEEFAVAFKKNAADAIATFLEGLQGITEEGSQTFRTLEELGLDADRLQRVVLNLSNAQDSLRDTVAKGRAEWERNLTLTETVGIAYGTTGSKLEMLKNRVDIAASRLGDALIPSLKVAMTAFRGLLQVMTVVIGGFHDLPESIQFATVGLAALVAGLGPLLLILAAVTKAAQGASVALAFLSKHPLVVLGTAVAVAVLAIGTFTLGMSKAAAESRKLGEAATTAAEKVKILSTAFENFGGTEKIQKLEAELKAINEWLDKVAKGGDRTQLGPAFKEMETRAAGLTHKLEALRSIQARIAEEAKQAGIDEAWNRAADASKRANDSFKLLGDDQKRLAAQIAIDVQLLEELVPLLGAEDERVLELANTIKLLRLEQLKSNEETEEAAKVVAGADRAYKELGATLAAIDLTGRMLGGFDVLGAKIKETEGAIADMIAKGKEQKRTDIEIGETQGVKDAVATLERLKGLAATIEFGPKLAGQFEGLEKNLRDAETAVFDYAAKLEAAGASTEELRQDETFQALVANWQQARGEIQGFKTDFETMQQAMTTWLEDIRVSSADVFVSIVDGLNRIAEAAAHAFVQMLVSGTNFADAMSGVFASLAADLIAWVLKMLIEYVAVKITEIVYGSIAAYAEFPIVGLALGIAAAAAAIGAAKALSSSHGGKTLKEGGITTGPTHALIGEAGTEVVAPLDELLAMMRHVVEGVMGVVLGPNLTAATAEDPMDSGIAAMVRSFKPQPLTIKVENTLVTNARALARTMAEELPFVLRKKLGNAFG